MTVQVDLAPNRSEAVDVFYDVNLGAGRSMSNALSSAPRVKALGIQLELNGNIA
jgi:hypothetical protein